MSHQLEAALGYSQEWLECISSMKPPITTCLIVNTDELAKQILACTSEKFTGRWDFEGSENQNRSLYFSEGLICGGSGIYPIRSWYRQLSRHCPQLMVNTTPDSLLTDPWTYDILAQKVKDRKISHEQITIVVESYITEILFDIIQELEQHRYPSGLRLSQSRIPQDIMNSALVGIPADLAWSETIKFWQAWQEAGLIDVSPNLGVRILKVEELKQKTSALVYENLIALADGNQTFRDLAVKLNRNLLLLTKPILPYIRQGLIGLTEIGDLSLTCPSPVTPKPNEEKTQEVTEIGNTPLSLSSSSSALVACIDDSPVDILIMNQILTQAGYQFINIQNQENALLTLLSQKPDLIFLDLMMPIANGYEICAQIRRVPFFKNTPVIIVTGKDGVVDRARAKMVGSSGFLTKPIDREKVMKVLQMYLSSSKSSQSEEGIKSDRPPQKKGDSLLQNLKNLDSSELIQDVLKSSIKQKYS